MFTPRRVREQIVLVLDARDEADVIHDTLMSSEMGLMMALEDPNLGPVYRRLYVERIKAIEKLRRKILRAQQERLNLP